MFLFIRSSSWTKAEIGERDFRPIVVRCGSRMDIATWIRIFAGIVVMAGLTCIPIGLGAHPYYFTSWFSFLAESGGLLRAGAILIASGLVVFICLGSLDKLARYDLVCVLKCTAI
jgi:hypothetical protein